MKMKTIAIALTVLGWAGGSLAYDLSVSASAQNQVVSGSSSYTLPKGTKSVGLLYNVFSAEYPDYVTQQSIYNDVWSVTLSGPGGPLFNITRQINSQLTQPPTWQPDRTTGDIRQNIDISGLTASGPVILQIIATAMNVGDSSLTTIVRASLEEPPLLDITEATPDTITANNGGTYYSVPASGDTNALQRTFTLKLNKSEDITVSSVTVTLQGAGDLMNVVQQLPVPSGNDVQVISQSDTEMTVKVRVTIRDPVSSVNGNPPPTHSLSYHFQVEGTDAAGTTVDAEKTVTGRRALWRMGNVLASRYGSRDSGHDDWGSHGTYQWLQQHIDLIKAVDDISGEHGRNIGHTTHQYGTDIDMYHFHRFAGATSGTDNYNRLRNTALTAFGTLLANGTSNPNPPQAAVDARNNLTAFVTATRTGLANLAALPSVSRLYYAIGTVDGTSLPNGWARSLIENGRVSRTVNGVVQTVDLGLGNWSRAKVTYNSVHNNHVHVTLDRPAIGE